MTWNSFYWWVSLNWKDSDEYLAGPLNLIQATFLMLDGNGSNKLNLQLLMVEESVLGTRYKTTVQQFLNQAYRLVQLSNVTLENPEKLVKIFHKNSLLHELKMLVTVTNISHHPNPISVANIRWNDCNWKFMLFTKVFSWI